VSGIDEKVLFALAVLDRERPGKFVTILAECWNAKNLFIFRAKESCKVRVLRCAVALVRSFREVREYTSDPLVAHQQSWPPSTGLLNVTD